VFRQRLDGRIPEQGQAVLVDNPWWEYVTAAKGDIMAMALFLMGNASDNIVATSPRKQEVCTSTQNDVGAILICL